MTVFAIVIMLTYVVLYLVPLHHPRPQRARGRRRRFAGSSLPRCAASCRPTTPGSSSCGTTASRRRATRFAVGASTARSTSTAPRAVLTAARRQLPGRPAVGDVGARDADRPGAQPRPAAGGRLGGPDAQLPRPRAARDVDARVAVGQPARARAAHVGSRRLRRAHRRRGRCRIDRHRQGPRRDCGVDARARRMAGPRESRRWCSCRWGCCACSGRPGSSSPSSCCSCWASRAPASQARPGCCRGPGRSFGDFLPPAAIGSALRGTAYFDAARTGRAARRPASAGCWWGSP